MILITGATGNVGSEVVKQLLVRDCRLRIGTRTPHHHPWKGDSRVEAITLDLRLPGTFAAALSGVDRIFLMRPPDVSQVKRDMLPFLTAAKDAGIRHVTFLSLLGAEKNGFMPHRKIELLLQSHGFSTTFLRASFFMQNLSTIHLNEIRYQDRIFVPAGHGRTSFIDVRDIAEIAARSLIDERLGNRSFDLTGSEALTYDEVAAIMTAVLGREIQYVNPSSAEFFWKKWKSGSPPGLALVMTGIYAVCKLGLAGRTSRDSEQILGRPPISFRQFVRDHRELWLSPG